MSKRETKVLAVSKGWLEPMESVYNKPFDIRQGRREFEVGEIVKFVENETGAFMYARIATVINSWETPDEWKWNEEPNKLGDFSVLTFAAKWIDVDPFYDPTCSKWCNGNHIICFKCNRIIHNGETVDLDQSKHLSCI